MRFCLSLVMVAVACLVGAPCWGQTSEREYDANARFLIGDEVNGQDPFMMENPDWGPGYVIRNMGAAGFSPKYGSMVWDYHGVGYINHASGPDSQYWMPVDLPVGAYLHGMRVFYYDGDATYELTAWFTRYYGSTSPGYEDLVTWYSSGSPGYTSSYVLIGETILYDDVDGEQSYNVILRPGTTGTTLAFKGVRLLYYLQVSPAPASATFGDVGTGHWAFQFVEALAASGITAGCGGGNFCPDANVTRAEMAVFLSSALGLHWQ